MKDGYCIGCGRTVDDLIHWMRYTNEQRLKAIREGEERMENMFDE